MNEKITCLVTVSGEKSFRDFYASWKNELQDINSLVIENNAGRTFECRTENTTHLSWIDIDRDLGKNYWIIPRNNVSILSYGCYKASKNSDIIILLDEKAKPESDKVIQKHVEVLNKTQKEIAWTNVIANIKPKGTPFHNVFRKVPLYMNHGLWTENAVIDAATELSLHQNSPLITCNSTLIPRGHYFSMSSINLAIRSEVAPLMYFLLMGEDYPFECFGDIWAGVIAKKVMDHLNMGCRSGEPLVKNFREVDIWKSLRAESNTLPLNESFWEKIDSINLTCSEPNACYAEIANIIKSWGHPYFQKLGQAMKIWSGLYSGETVQESSKEDKRKSPSQLLRYIKEPLPKNSRPKLPEESQSLLEFLHSKSQIQSPQKSNMAPDVIGSQATSPRDGKLPKKAVKVEARKTLSASSDQVSTVKVSDEDGEVELGRTDKYHHRPKSQELKPYLASSQKSLAKKPSTDAFIPGRK